MSAGRKRSDDEEMIRLTRKLDEEIGRHGEETYPHECCGFLLGEVSGGTKVVREIHRAGNAREDSPRNRYLIEPIEFLHVQRAASERRLDIVGFYHSHPDVAARPSQFDRDHAWTWYSYVILSVRDGRARELLSWILGDEEGPFAAEEIRVEAREGSPAGP